MIYPRFSNSSDRSGLCVCLDVACNMLKELLKFMHMAMIVVDFAFCDLVNAGLERRHS